MRNEIDCLLIGPQDMCFSKYEHLMRTSGINNPAYRDINLKFLRYNKKAHSILELFELFAKESFETKESNAIFNTQKILTNATAYLCSYLHKNGFKFDYINSFNEEKDRLTDILQKLDILTVGIITTGYVTPLPILEIVSFIRKYNSKVKIIVGGPFVWYLIHQQTRDEINACLNLLNADFYVNSSQGETTLIRIIQALKDGLSLDHINNIYFKVNGKYESTTLKSENNKLEDNIINWSLFSDYSQKMVFARTSLSCLYNCAFCDFPVRVGKYSDLSVDFVEKELNGIAQLDSIESIRFVDDTLNVPKERFKAILKMMIKNKYKFRWASFIRCQYLDREIIELMIESGCEAVHIGLESGSSKVLKNMNKKTKIEYYINGLNLLNEYDITSYATFIIGFPGETDDTVQETVSFIEKHIPTFSFIWPWYCSPLTPVWQERKKYDLYNWGTNWKHNTMDANKAMDNIEEILIFGSLKNSIFCSLLPEYITYFSHFGITTEQIKSFLNAFNDGIREKLLDQSRKEVSAEVVGKIKSSLLK